MAAASNENAPFSFEGLESKTDNNVILPPPTKLLASDGIEISMRVYRPQPPSAPESKSVHQPTTAGGKGILIFYHGGGAHSGAGYGTIGQTLASVNGITVYMPDLRGHGTSGGPRGDAPSPKQVFQDIDSVIKHVTTHEKVDDSADGADGADRDIPIFLGGHSSGAGLVINYVTYASNEKIVNPSLAGYVLVAPQLGYKSQTARPTAKGRTEFAQVQILPFILNGIFGICGHSKAVKFNYPTSTIETYGVIGYNTVNMANAITPEDPKEQMGRMDLPVGLWIGSEDELFLPAKVVDYLELLPREGEGDKSCGKIIEGATHLGILVHDQFLSSIGDWMNRL